MSTCDFVQGPCYEMEEVFVLDPYRAPGMAGCTLSARFATELALELEPGERIVWTGLPRHGALARRALAALWLPLLYNGFVLGLVALCGDRLSLAAVPLLTFALPLFRGPLGAWGGRKTMFYAVTDRRALLFDGDGISAVRLEDLVAVRARGGEVVLSVRKRQAVTMVGLPDAGRVAALVMPSSEERFSGSRLPGTAAIAPARSRYTEARARPAQPSRPRTTC